MTRSSAILLVLLPACREPDAPTSADAGADASIAEERDASTDAALDAPPESECPPPPFVAPADTPEGYLDPVAVGYVRTVDGDTAHLLFEGGEETIRFLYVNTEETRGDEATEFGAWTSDEVEGLLAGAGAIVAAVRESRSEPGTPNLDPYGRWLSLLFLDGELLQTTIVRRGLSAYYTRYGCAPEPVHSALLWAEAEARAAGRGIWEAGHSTDYQQVLADWIEDGCRPNPYEEPVCP